MKALIALLLTLFCSLSLFAQNAKIDSLKKVIATTKVDTVRGRSLCRLCWELTKIGDYENGIKKGEEGLALSEKQKDQRGIADCNNNLGNIFKNQGFSQKAMVFYEKSIALYGQIGLQSGIAKSLTNMGLIFRDQGIYPKALDCYFKSLKIFFQIGDESSVATCYKAIGDIYNSQSDSLKAFDYYHKSLKIFERIGNQSNIASCLQSIGIMYGRMDDYINALQYFHKSLDVAEKMGNQTLISNCLECLGNIYLLQNNNHEALKYYKKSLIISESLGLKDHIGLSNIHISNVYHEIGNAIEAKKYAGKGLQIVKETENLEWMKLGAEALYQADSALGDWKSAFEHHKLYKQYSDSLHNEEKAKEFGRIESRYQFEKEAEEAKRKEQEAQRLAQLETERRNNLQYLSIFAGILVIFGGLAFMGRFKIPVRVLDVALFAALLILFEFLLILFDPVLDQYTGGIPVQKLVFNSVIALGFAPLHTFLETKLRQRLVYEVKPATVPEPVAPAEPEPKSDEETDPQ
jgi:tetratricopeptide (TPR) repeat protein